MSYRLEFEIPFLPKTTNAQTSMHWAQKAKYVKQWHKLVGVNVCKKKPAAPLEKAVLTLTRFSTAEPDFDNLVISFKPVIDALVVCGVLVNDKPSNIGESKYRWEKTKRVNQRIKVIVEGA